MKKLFLIFVAAMATLLVGRTAVAQEDAPLLNPICQQEPVDIYALAQKVKSHGIGLKGLQCAMEYLKQEMVHTSKQATEAKKKNAAEGKRLHGKILNVEKFLKQISVKIEEINSIGADTEFGRKLREVLLAEILPVMKNVADGLAAVKEGLTALDERVKAVEASDIKQDARLDTLEKAVFTKQDQLKFGLSGGGWISRPGMGGGAGPSLLIPMSERTDLEIKALFGASGDGMGYLVQFGFNYRFNLIFGLRLMASHIGDAGSLKNGLKASTIGAGPGISFYLHPNFNIFIDGLVGAGGKRGGGVQFDGGGALGVTYSF